MKMYTRAFGTRIHFHYLLVQQQVISNTASPRLSGPRLSRSSQYRDLENIPSPRLPGIPRNNGINICCNISGTKRAAENLNTPNQRSCQAVQLSTPKNPKSTNKYPQNGLRKNMILHLIGVLH